MQTTPPCLLLGTIWDPPGKVLPAILLLQELSGDELFPILTSEVSNPSLIGMLPCRTSPFDTRSSDSVLMGICSNYCIKPL